MGESKDASEGEVWLYNPDLEKVGTWEISSLQCLNHDNECDGLHAVYEEGHDTRHALLVPVPVSMMEYAGTYIFVLRIKDNHPELYRDHQHRWTLELNSTHIVPPPIVYFSVGDYHVVWCRGEKMNRIVKTTTRIDPAKAYAARDWVQNAGAGHIRAAVNGNFFYPITYGSSTATIHMLGEMGAGWQTDWWCYRWRWCFGMKATGKVFGVEKMVETKDQKGNPAWTVHPRIKREYQYGLSNVGLLVSSYVPQTYEDSSWSGDPRPTDPDCQRTAIAWAHHSGEDNLGDFFLIVTSSSTWSGVAGFITSTLESEMKRRYGRDIDISCAVMLDGGGSSQLSYCRKDRSGTIIEEHHPVTTARRVVNLVTVDAVAN